MKIKLSKSQWDFIGKKSGWLKSAQTAQQGQSANSGYQGMTYSAIIQKNPSIGQTVNWIQTVLAAQKKTTLMPDQEKQLRAQQTNLRVALDKMGIQWKQFPEFLAVLSTPTQASSNGELQKQA